MWVISERYATEEEKHKETAKDENKKERQLDNGIFKQFCCLQSKTKEVSSKKGHEATA